jgi:insulysin
MVTSKTMVRRKMVTLILLELMAASFLASQNAVVAFQPLRQRAVVRHLNTEVARGLLPATTTYDSRTCVRMVSKPSGENTSDPDRVRRRQLLFSMLAGVSASAFVQTSPAQAEEGASTTPVTTTASEILIDVIKPPLDDREYVTYTLNNGLRVLLCSDPSSNEAAAAMDVHVGACSDPQDVPGLAHFNEHMLFLGTKKYPKEASFESFLASNGGSSNAYTDSENTVYYFAMGAEADSKLSEGLSRFGSFFTAPLFTEGATGRELNAIESENSKNLQSDIFRTFQVAKARANPNHPFSKFFTGNKMTLLDNTKAKGINLRDQLIQFYNRYYSANQMTLAVVAPQSIDTLKKMVEESFGDVPNRKVGKPEEAWAGTPPYTVDSLVPSFNHVVEIVPVIDLRQVTVAWPISFLSDKDRLDSVLIKPSNYVAHLIGHEGPNSLFSYLKRKGWANSLACAQEEELSDFEVFEVVVGLTTSGLAAVDNVIEAVYSYLSLLRDNKIPDYVFNEVLQLEELDWRFKTKGGVGGYVQSLATAMQKYPPPLYVAGPRRLALEEYGTNLALSAPRTTFSSMDQLELTRSETASYASKLTVDNAIVTILSKTFENQADQKEKWYGTKYRVRAIPSSTIDQWKNCARPSELKINFPKPNPFIPSESGLRVKIAPSPDKNGEKRSFESRMMPIPPPTVIRDDGPEGRWTVHYKQDDRFGQPKAYMVFQILTKEVYASPMRAALANFYEICVADHLDEYAYDGKFVHSTTSIFPGRSIQVSPNALDVSSSLLPQLDSPG